MCHFALVPPPTSTPPLRGGSPGLPAGSLSTSTGADRKRRKSLWKKGEKLLIYIPLEPVAPDWTWNQRVNRGQPPKKRKISPISLLNTKQCRSMPQAQLTDEREGGGGGGNRKCVCVEQRESFRLGEGRKRSPGPISGGAIRWINLYIKNILEPKRYIKARKLCKIVITLMKEELKEALFVILLTFYKFDKSKFNGSNFCCTKFPHLYESCVQKWY